MRYRVSDAADRDLDEIFVYWATHVSFTIAEKIIDGITDRLWLLGEYPRCGKHMPHGLFCFPAGNYLIYYHPTRRGTDIIHIFHGSRNQSRALKTTKKIRPKLLSGPLRADTFNNREGAASFVIFKGCGL